MDDQTNAERLRYAVLGNRIEASYGAINTAFTDMLREASKIQRAQRTPAVSDKWLGATIADSGNEDRFVSAANLGAIVLDEFETRQHSAPQATRNAHFPAGKEEGIRKTLREILDQMDALQQSLSNAQSPKPSGSDKFLENYRNFQTAASTLSRAQSGKTFEAPETIATLLGHAELVTGNLLAEMGINPVSDGPGKF